MTDYSRSNILLPHFEEAQTFLTALAGQDVPFTFQTFDDVKGRQDIRLLGNRIAFSRADVQNWINTRLATTARSANDE